MPCLGVWSSRKVATVHSSAASGSNTLPSPGIPLRALTCHQVEAFLLLDVGPHLAGEEVQLDGGTVYLQGVRTAGGLKDWEGVGNASPSSSNSRGTTTMQDGPSWDNQALGILPDLLQENRGLEMSLSCALCPRCSAQPPPPGGSTSLPTLWPCRAPQSPAKLTVPSHCTYQT